MSSTFTDDVNNSTKVHSLSYPKTRAKIDLRITGKGNVLINTLVVTPRGKRVGHKSTLYLTLNDLSDFIDKLEAIESSLKILHDIDDAKEYASGQ